MKEKASFHMKSSPSKVETQHTVCWVALFSGSKKMRVSVSSFCNTDRLWLAESADWLGLPNPVQVGVGTLAHRGIIAGWNERTLSLSLVWGSLSRLHEKNRKEQKIFLRCISYGALSQTTMASFTEVNAREHWDLTGKRLCTFCRHSPVWSKIKHTNTSAGILHCYSSGCIVFRAQAKRREGAFLGGNGGRFFFIPSILSYFPSAQLARHGGFSCS